MYCKHRPKTHVYFKKKVAYKNWLHTRSCITLAYIAPLYIRYVTRYATLFHTTDNARTTVHNTTLRDIAYHYITLLYSALHSVPSCTLRTYDACEYHWGENIRPKHRMWVELPCFSSLRWDALWQKMGFGFWHSTSPVWPLGQRWFSCEPRWPKWNPM